MSSRQPDENNRRSAIDILIIVLTGIVAFYVVISTVFVMIVELNDPAADTSAITDTLGKMIVGILSALLGLIAGKSGAK